MQTKCTAKTRDGDRCKNPPVRGATTCRMHGASAPQVKAAAQRRIAEADATAALAYVGSRDFDDPLLELGRLASEALAMKDALAARVNALSQATYESFDGRNHLRVEVELYERALDRSAKFLETLARTGFEARRVTLAENDARVIAWILRGFISDLALDAAEQARAEEALRKWTAKAAEVVESHELPAGA